MAGSWSSGPGFTVAIPVPASDFGPKSETQNYMTIGCGVLVRSSGRSVVGPALRQRAAECWSMVLVLACQRAGLAACQRAAVLACQRAGVPACQRVDTPPPCLDPRRPSERDRGASRPYSPHRVRCPSFFPKPFVAYTGHFFWPDFFTELLLWPAT